jgi:hypothetical protein
MPVGGAKGDTFPKRITFWRSQARFPARLVRVDIDRETVKII